jgi:transcriptional regulator with XRE-family HTH domain
MSTGDDGARNKRVGAVIRKRRQVLGWEQQELAERVGVHVNSVQKWEAGTHYPSRKLGKLEEVLGVSLSDGTEPEPDIVPAGLREHVREILPPERAAAVEAAIEAALRGEPPVSRGPNGPRESRAAG